MAGESNRSNIVCKTFSGRSSVAGGNSLVSTYDVELGTYVWYSVVMSVTASKLRENIYRILDEAVDTGVPVEVVRKGVILRIVPEKKVSKLSRLKRRKAFVGDPDDLLKTDWSSTEGYKEWIEKWNARK